MMSRGSPRANGAGAAQCYVPALVLVLTTLGLHAETRAGTLHVPSEYPTIQAAVDSAAPGDEVLVAPGTYPENVSLHVPGLTLRSETDRGAIVRSYGTLVRIDADSVTVVGLVVKNAAVVGGVTFRVENDAFTIESCDLIGGGNVLRVAGDGTVRSCSITGGESGVQLLNDVRVSFDNCDISFNGVRGGFDAWGGVTATFCTPERPDATFTGCRFVGNRHWNSGGAVFAEGVGTRLVFEACLFAHNRAYTRAAISSSSAALTIRSSTFVNNVAESSGGSIITIEAPAQSEIDRCIIAFNQGVALRCAEGAPLTFTCTDVFGNTADDLCGQDGGGNFHLDPLFCDLEAGDYELRPGSPCAGRSRGACALIGAFPVGECATPVIGVTWGGLKERFAPGKVKDPFSHGRR